jgi:hypothetical protein
VAAQQHNMDNNHLTTITTTNGGVQILNLLMGTLLKLGAQNRGSNDNNTYGTWTFKHYSMISSMELFGSLLSSSSYCI